MREIDRYQRATLREQLLELLGWFRTHKAIGAILVVFAIGWLTQIVAPPRPADPVDLAVGDCLYARTGSSMDVGPTARPIGPPADVEAVVLAGRAERASCSLSHGHEVSAVVALGAPGSAGASGDPGSAAPTPAGTGAAAMTGIRAFVQARCDAAFEVYVGRSAAGSIYETFAAVPTLERWEAGERTAVCLVARRDGQWMGSPARGSRE
jgi:hypothetical protein